MRLPQVANQMPTATFDNSTTAVLEQPTYGDPAGEIPRANILPAARDFADERLWINIPNVPVFAEHSTVTRQGRELTFGRAELQAVAARCNQRIRETGDYAGIVIGHTPDPGDPKPAQPQPLVGVAGPFRVGVIQQPNGRAKWAILADLHYHRDQQEAIRRYPRRSAELWVEDSYQDMYLDPIALLGADAPRLDMGLTYSAVSHRSGRAVEIEKYQACSPSATSVFIPGQVSGGKKHHENYEAAGSADAETPDDTTTVKPNSNSTEKKPMALAPDDLQQIVAAIEQLDWVQGVKQMLASQAPAAPAVPDAPIVPPAAPAAPLAPEPAPEPAPAPSPAPSPEPDGDEQLPMKYSRLHGEVTRLNATVDALNKQLDAERGARINTERYAALQDCRRVKMFDLDAEFEIVKYGKVTNEQFTAHIERINANYRDIPVGVDLPIPGLAVPPATAPGSGAAKEKYSKEMSDRALKICKQKSMAGEKVDYASVLEQVVAGTI